MARNNGTDLLDSITDDGAVEDDLLATLGEGDDAEPWGNPENTQPGDGVQGTVVALSTTTSEYTTDPIPVVTIETAGGKRVRITAYQSVLRREIQDIDPQRGDLFAAKYLGKKKTKDGKREFHAYKAAARPAARQAAAATAAPAAGAKRPF